MEYAEYWKMTKLYVIVFTDTQENIVIKRLLVMRRRVQDMVFVWICWTILTWRRTISVNVKKDGQELDVSWMSMNVMRIHAAIMVNVKTSQENIHVNVCLVSLGRIAKDSMQEDARRTHARTMDCVLISIILLLRELSYVNVQKDSRVIFAKKESITVNHIMMRSAE